MAVTASLGQAALTVEPGGTVATDVTVRNDDAGGTAVTVKLTVTGAGRPFSYVVPDTLVVDAGGTATARVGFRVPRTSVPAAGPLAFGLAVDGATAAEGAVDVLPFSVLSLALDPGEASGKGPVKHTVSVANRGNAPMEVTLAATADDGLDVLIEPPTVTAAPDKPATASLEVTPTQKLFTGDEKEMAFTVTATPAVGQAVECGGRYRQQVAIAMKKLVTSGVVALVAVVALIAGVAAFAGGGSPSAAKTPAADADPTTGGALNACPAKGHEDGYANGLNPDAIKTLSNVYSFLMIKPDGCQPVRFNPCEPIHYVQNLARAPVGGPDNVRQAFKMLGDATGITFVDDGTTDETVRGRTNYLPDRYGPRWAPILVSWIPFGNQGSDPSIQAVGRGIGFPKDGVLVSGQLSLNIDAITNSDTKAKVQPGFGPQIGTGTGAIGHDDVQWGRIILHELAHVIGLGHTRDKGAIMYPETADQTSRPAEYRPPDKEGLRYLGKEAGCLTTPAPA